jgi:MFS family permease
MVDELMRDFSITATMLGNLSAIYFYTYAAMQIPSGLLADAVGPRRVGTAAAVVAAIGMVLFALADSLWMASFGRGLIGASVAVAFVACMKLAGPLVPRQPLRHCHRRLALDRQPWRRAGRRAAVRGGRQRRLA